MLKTVREKRRWKVEETRKESRRSSLSSLQMGRSAIGLSRALSGALEKRTSAGVHAQQLQRGAVITEICYDCSSSYLAQPSGNSLTNNPASDWTALWIQVKDGVYFLRIDINDTSSLLPSHKSTDPGLGAAILFWWVIYSQMLCISTLFFKLLDLFHPYGSVSAQF